MYASDSNNLKYSVWYDQDGSGYVDIDGAGSSDLSRIDQLTETKVSPGFIGPTGGFAAILFRAESRR
ncbi:MAG TPA: hypothetical protein VHA82_20030 [Ramlibacter sp.]|uniref:hypothetical protein n=1 Tax=Ramlibacter sp. TaxID=1917967 RepID=UPI002C0B6D1C|nr:hypothetical protein [Ramlibacter sp.]HVZ46106.1 hypothetical protein [Ramlibacter sp.]